MELYHGHISCSDLDNESACLDITGCDWNNSNAACVGSAVVQPDPDTLHLSFETNSNTEEKEEHPELKPIHLLVAFIIVVVTFRYMWRKSAKWFPGQDNESQLCKSKREQVQWSNVFTMFLNGTAVTLINPDPEELLASFIRNKMELKGTKLGCEEGGCGACTVVLSTNENDIRAVNACLRPLCSNDGVSITTVEKIGNVSEGMSAEQTSIVENNGTQCGYCTPGWVTTMAAYNEAVEVNGTAPGCNSTTDTEREHYLDGNICRCTGYKPILKAFKESSSSCSSSINTKYASKGREGVINTPSLSTCCKDVSKCGTSAGCDWSQTADMEELLQHKREIALDKSASKCSNTPTGIVRKIGNISKRKTDLELMKLHKAKPLHFYNIDSKKHWYRPLTLSQMCTVLNEYNGSNIQLVGGNTSIGITKYFNGSAPYYVSDAYDVYIDINKVEEFTQNHYNPTTQQCTVGAGLSINKLIDTLRKHSGIVSETDNVDAHNIFAVTANHLHHIAGTQVRNAGTWAGNLACFLKYPTFPSDAVLALTTANTVQLQCCDRDGECCTMTMPEFLKISYDEFSVRGLFIISLTISNNNSQHTMGMNFGNIEHLAFTYKVAQRSTNAHSYVNAGFNFCIKRDGSSVPLCQSVRMVFGGVSEKTFIATNTEAYLKGTPLTSATLQQAYITLQTDLADVGLSQSNLTFVSADFLTSVMYGCVYRAFLSCYRPNDVPMKLRSAIAPWVKPESRGTEVFLPSSKSEFSNETPLGMPIHKLEAKIQATGEAVYPSDTSVPSQGLFGAMIYSTKAAVTLADIDVSQAVATSGVVAVYTAVDIPGSNNVTPDSPLFVPIGGEVTAVGVPVGVVIATTEAIANKAASLVSLTYKNGVKKVIANLEQAIEQESFFKIPNIPGVTVVEQGSAADAMPAAYQTCKGYISASGQNHFYMEAQTATASIVDGDCVDVTCGSQDPAGYQGYVANLLGLPQNKVIVKCPRAGGAFGGKITHGIPCSTAAALASLKLKRTVRMFNSRTADMIMSGGREAFSFDYEVGFTSDGVITALIITMYVDAGNDKNDAMGGLFMAMNWADNAYYFPNYTANAKMAYTNTPARTSMRAPGVVQACFATEAIVERVAYELNLPTYLVQQRNFIQNGQTTILGQPITDCTLPTVWNTLIERSQFNSRYHAVIQYNSMNTYRKRGISIVPVKYGMGWAGYNAGITIGIRQTDGTVTVTHNGCEIGQGINTKVVQTVANQLGIDISLIRCTSTGTDKVANGGVTGGSGTSEVVCQAAVNACKVLNERLAPFVTNTTASNWAVKSTLKASYKAKDDWVALLSSLPSDVSLNAQGWYSPTANPNQQDFQYFVYGACVSEIELLTLTGEVHVLASEIVYDCGVSLNPAVDIGQIEGGLVMGLGYFLQEHVQYDSKTADLDTIGTWEYKPPNAQDVPSVFNVTLLPNLYNKDGILGSKATGEPPYILANSIYFATKMAIDSSRNYATRQSYQQLACPLTVDIRQQACMNSNTLNRCKSKSNNQSVNLRSKEFYMLPY